MASYLDLPYSQNSKLFPNIFLIYLKYNSHITKLTLKAHDSLMCSVFWGCATILTTGSHVTLITANRTTFMSFFFHNSSTLFLDLFCWRGWDNGCAEMSVAAQQLLVPGSPARLIQGGGVPSFPCRSAWTWGWDLSCGTSGKMTWKQPGSQRKPHPTSPVPPADGRGWDRMGQRGLPRATRDSDYPWGQLGKFGCPPSAPLPRRPARLLRRRRLLVVHTAASGSGRSGRTRF